MTSSSCSRKFMDGTCLLDISIGTKACYSSHMVAVRSSGCCHDRGKGISHIAPSMVWSYCTNNEPHDMTFASNHC